jgi:phosphoribosylanthranilate isomerase
MTLISDQAARAATQRRTRIKICGITRPEDAACAVQNGADAIGLVMYPRSPRAVGLRQARLLRREVPAFTDAVVLLVNASHDEVREIIDQVAPDLLQFHGDESPEFCSSFGHRYVRAFRVGAPGLATREQVLAQCQRYGDAAGWLFDSYSSGYGGSGMRFDAALLQSVRDSAAARAVIAAGGLNAENVHATLDVLHPFAVDVSSGVETSPGVKSAQKIASFVRAVRRYDTGA